MSYILEAFLDTSAVSFGIGSGTSIFLGISSSLNKSIVSSLGGSSFTSSLGFAISLFSETSIFQSGNSSLTVFFISSLTVLLGVIFVFSNNSSVSKSLVIMSSNVLFLSGFFISSFSLVSSILGNIFSYSLLIFFSVSLVSFLITVSS